jgi:lambda repressor-like predicted transcriptional regulator
MSTNQHPLMTHLQKTGTSLSAFAKEAKTSRMQLYRIMAGAATTTSRLEMISAATGGKLSVADLLPKKKRAAA